MSCLGTRRKKKVKDGKKAQSKASAELEEEHQSAVTGHSSDDSFDVSRLEKAKRRELQILCKKAGLKANGKNVDMVTRLKEHYLNKKNKDQSSGDVKCSLAEKENSQTEQQEPSHSATEKTRISLGDHVDCQNDSEFVHFTKTNTTRDECVSLSGDSQESSTPSKHPRGKQSEDANCQPGRTCTTVQASNGTILRISSRTTAMTECSPTAPLADSEMNAKECMFAVSTLQLETSEEETSVGEKQGHSSGLNSLSVSVTQTVDICPAAPSQGSVTLPTSTTSTKWCVVDGILKQDDEKTWRQVRLKGGRPVVPNRFGKYIEFNLAPNKREVSQLYQDNFICGTCVRKNENLQKTGNTGKSSRAEHQKFCGNSTNTERGSCTTPLATQIIRDDTLRNSVKRKRDYDDSASLGQGVKENEMNVTKKQRKEQVGSQPGTPASPQVRRERGEDILLPRNLNKPWKPRKTRETPVPEDPEFARRVEEIMKNTRPGSAEEQRRIMSGTSTAVCRSPT